MKKIYLAVGLVCLLLSCNSEETVLDEEQLHEHQSSTHSNLERKSLEDLKGTTLFNEIENKYKLTALTGPSLVQQKAADNDAPFVITSDTVNVITKKDRISYSFLVETSGEPSQKGYKMLQNLVIESKDGETRAFLFSYELEIAWLEEFVSGERPLPRGKVSYQSYSAAGKLSNNLNKEACIWVEIEVPYPCGCGDWTMQECDGCLTNSPTYPGTRFTLQEMCAGSNGVDLATTEYKDIIGYGFGGGGYTSTPENTIATGLIMEDMTALQNFLYDEQVFIEDDFKNNPCLYNVYRNMGRATMFNFYLKNFDGDMSVANLRFDVDPNLPNNVNAITRAPDNYLISIDFNTNNLNRPSLDVARTFIHEIIHAEMFRKLLSLAQMGNIPWSENFINSIRNDYPGLHDYYMRWKYNYPNGVPNNSPQHEAMAEHYRNIVENALREYDETLTDNMYEALAWKGLMGGGVNSMIDPLTGLIIDKTTGENLSTVAWTNLDENDRLGIIYLQNNFNNSNPPCQL